MDLKCIICHYDEIALKGKNRKYFEKKLVENIKLALKRANINFDSISNLSGRILINLSNDIYKENEVKFALSKVFGIVNFSFALESSRELEEIKNLSLEMLRDKDFKTFRISATRSDKSFKLNSQEVNEKVGEHILNNLEKKVDLTNPDETVYVEITKDSTYIYLEKHKGYGGLPVGTGGRALSLMSGGIDSPVASFMIAKRGVKVDYIHFHSYPYTGKASIEKTKDIIKILQNFQLGNNLYLVPFADAQKEIVAKAPARFRIILYRRFMLRISEKIAKENGYLALITGESVGQVASQTLENIGAIGEVVDLPILRPISGMNKGEVIEIAKDIGTYKTSILPCQDTCSWFMPDKPATTPDIKKVRSAEADLTIDKLVDDMVKLTELVQVEKI